jgi:hypothetical protein
MSPNPFKRNRGRIIQLIGPHPGSNWSQCVRNGNREFIIGRRSTNCSVAYPFRGSIDEVRIYDRILTEAEIQELYDFNNSPEELLESLTNFVISLNLQHGISNSLDAKLESAIQALDDMN